MKETTFLKLTQEDGTCEYLKWEEINFFQYKAGESQLTVQVKDLLVYISPQTKTELVEIDDIKQFLRLKK